MIRFPTSGIWYGTYGGFRLCHFGTSSRLISLLEKVLITSEIKVIDKRTPTISHGKLHCDSLIPLNSRGVTSALPKHLKHLANAMRSKLEELRTLVMVLESLDGRASLCQEKLKSALEKFPER